MRCSTIFVGNGMTAAAAAMIAGTLAAGHAAAQVAGSVQFPSNYAPGQSPCVRQADGGCIQVSAAAPLPVAGKQESFALVSANMPGASITVHGGTYIVSQACASYGTVTVRYRGADGATMLPLLSRTSADAAGATLVSLGSQAVIDATVSGTSGCNITLARVPS